MINVTVDDNDHSILYSPAGAWNARSAALSCSACTAQPDPTKMVSGTWHDSTVRIYLRRRYHLLIFCSQFYPIDGGSAVYVFCALAESVKSPDGNSDMAFYVDGQLMGSFVKPALGINNTYEYQFPVFSANSLAPGEHTLVLQNGHVNGTQSLVLLDYIVYTYVLIDTPA
ncbi:hypothetical protein DFH05DRAFT_1392074 [Lentinula detonsa]|uniref:Uncharacterized protein n=1 Tax=Lentinula detonsa TaxID=2804962 RepID=A0A9W8U095_9AGAR|nr:hypothetical protein DFH05DRAFT_1392074 [Lentinula detonsa]